MYISAELAWKKAPLYSLKLEVNNKNKQKFIRFSDQLPK